MNFVLSTLIILVLSAILCSTAPAQSGRGEPFDEYLLNASWREQTFHLDNFAFFLKRNPETIGFIFLYTRSGESKWRASSRINRGVGYLYKRNSIPRSRLRICYRGESLFLKAILQPLDRKMALTEPCEGI
jgi:hypothetical protein